MGWLDLSFDLNLGGIVLAAIAAFISYIIATHGRILADHHKDVYEPIHQDLKSIVDKSNIEKLPKLGNANGILKKGGFSHGRLRGLESDVIELMSSIDIANQSYDVLDLKMRDELSAKETALRDNGVLPEIERITNSNANEAFYSRLFQSLMRNDKAGLRPWLSGHEKHSSHSDYALLESAILDAYDEIDAKISGLRSVHFRNRASVFQLGNLMLSELRLVMGGTNWRRYHKRMKRLPATLTDGQIAKRSLLLAIMAIALTAATAGLEIFYGMPSGEINLRTGARMIVGSALLGFSTLTMIWLAWPIYRDIRDDQH